ncbi:hypothetical protein PV755_45405 [Streptomyces caniscabiei]|uniref:Uncharacterized protein n=1 Tax=Streptomyces caniscabiei TaxID=2746961 RepID=A0A927QE43_9ACTN|nr:hypothetical protein [Streptomyces caniscabiei]MBD9723448.1 hypothetical protein [Streptomyces caniscabiei]MDX3516054.1 hypothetical protein [Streptomyces caniscabiei]MDX3725140.1 hypothetical protein [Streptomyces caniscabiei]WEO27018.1 hypothetical protein IHE65_29825 [Streptomyces caniscabiei]
MGVWYATRESVMNALDSKLTARNSAQIDRALESASRDVDALCHRKAFAPTTATKSFDYPGPQYARPWRLWLDGNSLISVTTLTSGGVTIAASDYFLEPNQYGPPYDRVEIDLDSSAAFSSGDTHQRAISITGLWGYTNDETTTGTLTEALDASETGVDVDGAAAALLGVGSVLRVDDERMIVTGRTMADTGQNLGADIDQQVKTVTIPVASGAAFTTGEVILIDAERMLIVDIAGNNLIVKRAWDGSANAAHTNSADIYALRTLTVQRGALGTTAATHSASAPILRWDPPGPVRDLTLAEAVAQVNNELSGYARTRKTGDGGSGERATDASALKMLRDRVYASHGRKGRVRAV